jgi:hypothetical protein
MTTGDHIETIHAYLDLLIIVTASPDAENAMSGIRPASAHRSGWPGDLKPKRTARRFMPAGVTFILTKPAQAEFAGLIVF